MKYMKMRDLRMKGQMSGPENAGPQKRGRKLENKMLEAITQCNYWVITKSECSECNLQGQFARLRTTLPCVIYSYLKKIKAVNKQRNGLKLSQ